jgi:hypothetical protein
MDSFQQSLQLQRSLLKNTHQEETEKVPSHLGGRRNEKGASVVMGEAAAKTWTELGLRILEAAEHGSHPK